MSYQVGLGASEHDLEVQGEIDFDFFDSSQGSCNGITQAKVENRPIVSNSEIVIPDLIPQNNNEVIRKHTIETVIPTPETYSGNNCGNSPTDEDPPIEELDYNGSKYSAEDDSISSSLSKSDLSSSSNDVSFEDDEHTDSMTDVSPLPSNCNLPVVKFDAEHNESHNLSFNNQMSNITGCHKKDSVKFSDTVNSSDTNDDGDHIDVDKLIKAIKTLEVKQNCEKAKKSTPLLYASSKHRKNMTFSNNDVRKIDQENQRLLKQIVKQQGRTKPHFTSVYSRPSSSAINRQKQQRQIELDNLALLRRLEAAKPTRDLCRVQLLNDYDRRSAVSSRASTRSWSRMSSQLSSCRSSVRSFNRPSTVNTQQSSKN